MTISVSSVSDSSATAQTVGATGATLTSLTFTLTFVTTSASIGSSSNGNLSSITLNNGKVVTGAAASVAVDTTHAYIKYVYTPAAGDTAANPLTVTTFTPSTMKFGLTTVSNAFTTYDSGNSVVCFLQGTAIATPDGERAVEAFRIGDLVTTLNGVARPIKWIGRVSIEAELLDAAEFRARFAPVLIRTGALGDGLPQRDLRVSPAHGMLIDGVLIPAAALVNGVSILRDTTARNLEYYHIELDTQDLLLSEGAPSESFVDDDSRAYFDNVSEYDALYGDEPATAPQMIQRVDAGYMLSAIRRRLADLAGIKHTQTAPGPLRSNVERVENGLLSGWVLDEAAPTTPVEVEVLVDGEVIGQMLANRYRFDLDIANLANGSCAFDFAVPSHVDSLDNVVVRRVTDGAVLHSDARVAAAT